jgi:Flp pilus assembly protein TadD
VIDSVKRGIALGLLILIAGCSRGSTGMGTGPPGIDVADAAMRGGSPELALQIANNVVAKYPGNESALLTQGEALTALGRTAEAQVAFQHALQTNPESVGGHIGLGRLLLASDPVAAEGMFLDALQHEPRNAVAFNDLGIARDLQGRHRDAQETYRQALGVQPDMSAAQVNLALSLAMSGQSSDAIQLLRPLASGPGASRQTRHDYAAVLTMGGDKAGAEQILSRDLPPEEVQQALDDFAAARPNAATSLLSPQTKAAAPAAPVAVPPAPARPAAAPAPAPSVASAAKVAAPSSGPAALPTLQVQLAGPTPSKDAAQVKWERLKKEMPELLGDREPALTEIQLGAETVWRVRTGGFADASAANSFCQRVRATGTTCVLVQ